MESEKAVESVHTLPRWLLYLITIIALFVILYLVVVTIYIVKTGNSVTLFGFEFKITQKNESSLTIPIAAESPQTTSSDTTKVTQIVGSPRIESGGYYINYKTSNWNLHKVDYTKKSEERRFKTRIKFSSNFSNPPNVVLALSGVSMSNESTFRLNITHIPYNDGFDLVIKTWGDTKVYAVKVSWLAIGVN